MIELIFILIVSHCKKKKREKRHKNEAPAKIEV